MATAKLFSNGRSQAVRLPKEFRFKEDEVRIGRIGDLVVLFPRKKGWDLLAQSLELFTPDFLAERRRQGRAERRKGL